MRRAFSSGGNIIIKKIFLSLLLAICLAAAIGVAGYSVYRIGTYIELYIELNDKVGNNAIIHDERILLRAKKSIDQFIHYKVMYYKDARFDVKMREDRRTFEITENDETYVVENHISMRENSDLNGGLSEAQEKQSIEWEDISKFPKYQRVLDESKKLLYAYIRKSDILNDKEYLISELEKISVKIGEIDTAGISITIEDTKTICINRSDIRKAVIVHEFIHALQDITRNGLDSGNPMFVEIMTDIITNAVYPNNNIFQMSMYRDYNQNVLNFIGIFREKAIEAFFYGYDVLYDEITEDEWYLFLYTIEAAVRAPGAAHYGNCYDHLISKWVGMGEREV